MNQKLKFSVPVLLLTFSLILSACSPALSLLSSSPLAQISPTAVPTAANPSPAVSIPVSGAALDSLQALQTTYEQVYQAVNPSVVNIQVAISSSGSLRNLPSDANPFQVPDSTQRALGSGFIWDTQGRIITNNHVIEGASTILVTLADGTTVEATLVGADPQSDLAVIKVDPSGLNLKPLTLLDSSTVKVGQLAIAIGNPYGLSGTMTEGIVSALSRSLPVSSSDGVERGSYTIPDIIQTNAAINPGNSGGVLVDVEGKVIGVTSAIRSSTDSNSGIGFVIPANIVQRVVPVLISNGSYEHARLGITATTVTYELAKASGLDTSTRGVLVINVADGSAADRAGLRGSTNSNNDQGTTVPEGGDIITAINGQPVQTFEDLTSYLFNNAEVGQKVQLTILRNGQEQTVELTLASANN